jgi:hypothetical protein
MGDNYPSPAYIRYGAAGPTGPVIVATAGAARPGPPYTPEHGPEGRDADDPQRVGRLDAFAMMVK